MQSGVNSNNSNDARHISFDVAKSKDPEPPPRFLIIPIAVIPLPSLMFFNLLSFGSPGIFLKSTFFGLKGPQETKADVILTKKA